MYGTVDFRLLKDGDDEVTMETQDEQQLEKLFRRVNKLSLIDCR